MERDVKIAWQRRRSDKEQPSTMNFYKVERSDLFGSGHDGELEEYVDPRC